MEILIFPRIGSERGKILYLPPQNYPRYIRTSLVTLSYEFLLTYNQNKHLLGYC